MTEDAKPESTEPESTEPDEAAPAKRRPVARGTSLRRPATAASSQGEADDAGKTHEADETPSADAPAADAVPGRPAPSYRLPSAIGAGAVALLVLAVLVAWLRPWAAAVDNRAFVDTGLTTQVTSVAKQAAKDIYTIDMNDLDPWEKRLAAVLTPGMITEAKKLRTAITQTAGALQDVKVKVDDGDLTAGVSLARHDHAEVLLNVRQQVSTQGVPFATMQSPMKFVLDRFDGTWKVSSITPL